VIIKDNGVLKDRGTQWNIVVGKGDGTVTPPWESF
jgi:hypothetical protein